MLRRAFCACTWGSAFPLQSDWRRKNAAQGGGVCVEASRSLWKRHCVSNASSRRVHGVCHAPASNIIHSIAPHRDHTELPRRSLRSHCAPTESFDVCRAFAGRWHSDHSALWTTIYKRECYISYLYEGVAPIRNLRRWYVYISVCMKT